MYFPVSEKIPFSVSIRGTTPPLTLLVSVLLKRKAPGSYLATYVFIKGGPMGERRKARRYEVYLPLQVCRSRRRPAEFYTAHLRDISRSGLYFHSEQPIDPGAPIELTFALPTDRDRGASVLVRASAKALRVSQLPGELTPIYGVAVTIDRIDFVRPVAAHVAA